MDKIFIEFIEQRQRNAETIKFNVPELWATLYSPEQRCYHVETLRETIVHLQAEVLTGHRTGYVLIGIFENRVDAIKYEPFNKTKENIL